MNDRQNSTNGRALRRRHWNGLALFAGGMVILVLVVALGANLMFSRMPRSSASSSPAPDAMTQAPAVPHARASQSPAVVHDLAPAVGTVQSGVPQAHDPAPVVKATATQAAVAPSPAFTPPNENQLPDGAYGKVVRLGEQIFLSTGKNAAQFVGNDLSCGNCHLDAGRKADSAPMWAAFIHYPAYRGKTGKVDTLAARIQGCFTYSMNGKAPPQDDEVMTALQTYFFWLATGAPVGTAVKGSGYPDLQRPAMAPDRARGAAVYAENCAFCHGANGQGQRSGTAQVFPPLWGPRSFNWGAGMHRIGTAAAFIHANMPLGSGGSLSEQQAWDVALFMNSHERPQDPRFTGSVEITRSKFHAKDDSMYGQTIDGQVLGAKR
ncbi:MAG: c-type cytochrome [Burkholderiaceae bacterium]